MNSSSDIREQVDAITGQIAAAVVGKTEVVEQLLIALLASGHIILEDVPGTGKTLLAKSLSKTLRCSFKRVQFTADLLPSDITGIHFFNQQEGRFELRQGPVFTNILLADELNRATPRTQSSLLECMEERQVTIDGDTYKLESPFLVIATQNPIENHGTFPLPEAQLDRFMMRVSMGYPTLEEETEILRRFSVRDPLPTLQPVLDREQLAHLRSLVPQVTIEEDLLRYLLSIVAATRTHPEIGSGVSPRGSLQLVKAAQARALLRGRDFILPDDIKALAVPVLAHRIQLKDMFAAERGRSERLIESIVRETPVPTEPALERR
ncbi:MoxR family ATPase [Cohnella lubricantis]|uniref:MoxR family ATPase n=1 Tax=Cohnella lubricantis TaxID=2163172 RepID=A0A841TDV4_9BACL|nr:MoxR family ATPase [Cohnella lubricantis]MBB6679464.1 MoxR family ATPase [Cohnella lubricantis]MBP2118201.1 MoxR-like ATPase [Cohnella lubricantis]